jgi:hypothetical protein
MTPSNDERPDRPAAPRADLLARLSRTSPTVVVFGALAVFLVVLLLPDVVGAVLVLLIAVVLGLLLSRTWPVLTAGTRAMRLVVIGLLLVVALLKFTA